jgi:hypothetical protein
VTKVTKLGQIDQINEAIVTQTPKKTSGTPVQIPFSASFQNALSQQIPNDTGSMRRTSGLVEPQSPIINQPDVSPTDVAGRTDRLLGLLESYVTGLENPGATLKELAPIVAQMKDEATQLMSSTDAHPAGGDDLNGIAAKAALTANVEYIKFQRGDYI